MHLSHTAARSGRLSSFLLGEMRMSTGLMNKLKWGDAIQVNGIPQHTDFPVRPGDVVTVRLDEEAPQYPAEEGPLSIRYEDEFLLAVDKPAGMLVHPSRSKNTGTLANFVAGYYQKTGQPSAFHPLTRLDRDTFGLVLLGKNAHIHSLLQAAPVEKTYHALVYGWPEPYRGRIEAPIARCPLPSLLRCISPEGKFAATAYETLERRDGCAKLALRPLTGRTHQLRLHCAHIGHPILGDPQYGPPESQAYSQTLGLTHQQLCAKHLRLPHPITGAEVDIWSEFEV